MNVLSIETSCDETSAAVVRDGRQVLSNAVLTQILKHRPYGGVVPEIASRCHVEEMAGMVDEAVRKAGVAWNEIDRIAVTYGPGLATSLLVGLTAGKALAMRLGVPLVGVNHIEAHVFSLFLGDHAPSPASCSPLLVLMVSGGHTYLIRMDGMGRYKLLGQTMDDAAGEALDKGANLMKLGYPGGPAIEQAARGGNAEFIRFPRGTDRTPGGRFGELDRDLCFSYSGLKTSLLYYLRDHPAALENGGLTDVAASYQEAVFDALLLRVERALRADGYAALGCVGGVARNQRLRSKLEDAARKHHVPLLLAAPEFCTDNAAMIAGLAGTGGAIICMDDGSLDVRPDLVIGSV